MRIKKGDYVEVISGSELGKRGRVLVALPRKNKVIIEGINYIYRHMRKNQKKCSERKSTKRSSYRYLQSYVVLSLCSKTYSCFLSL